MARSKLYSNYMLWKLAELISSQILTYNEYIKIYQVRIEGLKSNEILIKHQIHEDILGTPFENGQDGNGEQTQYVLSTFLTFIRRSLVTCFNLHLNPNVIFDRIT